MGISQFSFFLFNFLINRTPVCPQCRENVDVHSCKTVYFSMDKRNCLMCATFQADGDDLRRQLQQKNESIDCKDQMISELQMTFDVMEEQLIAKNTTIDELNKLIDQRSESLSEMEMELASKENQLVGNQRIVDLLNSNILAIKEVLDENDKLLKKEKESNDEKDEIINEMEATLNEKNEELGAMTKEIHKVIAQKYEKEKELTSKEDQLVEKHKVIDSMNREMLMLPHDLLLKHLKKKNEIISEMQMIFNERNNEQFIAERKKASELQKIIDRQNKILSEKEMELTSKENQLVEKQKTIDSLNLEMFMLPHDMLLKLLKKKNEMISEMQTLLNGKDG